MKQVRWDDVMTEELNPLATRQVLHTDTMTVSRLKLAKGAEVARHHHLNEQISTVARGVLRFEFDDNTVHLRQGESLVIPPHVPHAVWAEEDTDVTDVFSPRRDDWIRGEDAYLRATAVQFGASR